VTAPAIEHLPPSTAAAEAAAVLDRDGVVVIDGLFGPDVLAPVRAELAPHLEAAEPAGGEFLGHSTKAIPGLLAKAPSFAACVIDPLLLALADHALLPGCRKYQLQISTAQEVWAGGKGQAPHRDETVYGPYLDYSASAPQYVLGVIVAGSEFTAGNGATRIAPGSHRWPTEREGTDQDFVPAAMPVGSAVVYTGRTLHGAGRNTTTAGRTALIFGYSVGWLRQEENLLVEHPPELVARLPERAQQLVGYEAYSPILGWAAERDPANLSRPAPPGHTWPASVAAAELASAP
jgi:ectoine hydroxylase-related dioxygenase (phytanoyl-CoA dioxygenase family)